MVSRRDNVARMISGQLFTLDELKHLGHVSDYENTVWLPKLDRDKLLEEYWIEVRTTKVPVLVRCQFCATVLWAHAYGDVTFYRHGHDEQVYKASTPNDAISKGDTHSLMLWLNGLHARELVG